MSSQERRYKHRITIIHECNKDSDNDYDDNNNDDDDVLHTVIIVML